MHLQFCRACGTYIRMNRAPGASCAGDSFERRRNGASCQISSLNSIKAHRSSRGRPRPSKPRPETSPEPHSKPHRAPNPNAGANPARTRATPTRPLCPTSPSKRRRHRPSHGRSTASRPAPPPTRAPARIPTGRTSPSSSIRAATWCRPIKRSIRSSSSRCSSTTARNRSSTARPSRPPRSSRASTRRSPRRPRRRPPTCIGLSSRSKPPASRT